MTKRNWTAYSVAILALIWAAVAAAQTIDETIPATNAALLSAPVRNNFAAAKTLIAARVVGPGSSVVGNIPVFDGTSGKLLKASFCTTATDGSISCSGTSSSAGMSYAQNGAGSIVSLLNQAGRGLVLSNGGMPVSTYSDGTAGATFTQAGAGAIASFLNSSNQGVTIGTSGSTVVRSTTLSQTEPTNGATTSLRLASQTLTFTTGATKDTDPMTASAALWLGVTTRITTAIAGCTTISVGVSGDTGRWAASTPVTLGSTTDMLAYAANGSPVFVTGAGSVRITCNGGTFSAGVMKVVVHYIELAGPTS